MDRVEAKKLLKRADKAGSAPAAALLQHVALVEAKKKDREKGSGAKGASTAKVIGAQCNAMSSKIGKWKTDEMSRLEKRGAKSKPRKKGRK